MALLFFDGFTDVQTMPKPEWGVTSWNNGTGRNGQTNGAASVTTQVRTLTLPSTAATCILGWAQVYTASWNTNQYMALKDTAGTTQLVLFVNTTTGFIEIRRTNATGTLLGTSSGHTPISANSAWHHIQWKATLHTSTGISVVRFNDVEVLNLSGQVTSSLISNVATIDYHGLSLASIDDMWVCDGTDGTSTQGRANSDFLGDLRVMQHYPTAAGDTTQWTASTGSNWDCVDEVPPSTTDYVSANTSGNRDLYNITDLTGTITAVYGVRETIYVNKTDGGSTTLKPVIKENSTVTADSAQGLSTTANGIYGTTKWVKPSNSGTWSGTDVNNLQVGVELG